LHYLSLFKIALVPYTSRCLIIFLFLIAGKIAVAKSSYFPAFGITIMVADSTAGAMASATPDEYTAMLTPFDLAIRMDKEVASVNDYFETAARSSRNWTTLQQEELRTVFAGIETYLTKRQIKLRFPDTVVLIRTAAAEEFGAEGWTRRNRIMINADAPVSAHLIAHELFHVLSRYDTSLRNATYAVFGFRPSNNVVYKSALPYTITNPDAPYLAHYVRLSFDGEPQDAALLLYSKGGYRPGKGLEDYVALGLLLLEGSDTGKKPMLKNGRAVIYELNEVPELFKKIGTNTEYILHPEEIAAEHFATLLTGKSYPQQEYLDAMLQALKN
jgi:hypothetical protein